MTKCRVSAPFYVNNIYNDRIDEFDIRYTPGVNDGLKLVEFVDEFQEKMINIQMPNGVDAEDLLALRSFDNVRVRVCRHQDVPSVARLRERGFRFFFDESLRACNWKQLSDQISLGCCQVYVADDLTHDLKTVYNVCKRHDVGIRCVLNHVHSTGPMCGADPKDWFIRPDDMDYAEEIYDVFEFDCTYARDDDEYEWSKFDALYRTYFDRRKYVGNLQELNWQLRMPLMNASCIDVYAHRSNCRLHCVRYSSCEMCKNTVELANELHEKGIVVETKREEDQEDEGILS